MLPPPVIESFDVVEHVCVQAILGSVVLLLSCSVFSVENKLSIAALTFLFQGNSAAAKSARING
jgi:hypothetical protein